LGGRTLSINPKKGNSFDTPTQPFSVPEFKAKSFLPFIGTFEGHMGAIQIDIHGERYQRFLQGNGAVKNVRRRMVKYSDRTMCFDNFIVLDVPAETPNNKISKLYFEMQIGIPTLDYITMPCLNTKASELLKVYSDWQNIAESYKKGVVPQLSMSEDIKLFQSKLDALCDLSNTGAVQIINLLYADPDNNPHQFAAVWEKQETNVLFNCAKVPRSGKFVTDDYNEPHYIRLRRFGIDTVTYHTTTPSPGYIFSLQYLPTPETIDSIKDFEWAHHPGAAILSSTFWKHLPKHTIDCGCKVCKNKTQEEILNEYCVNEDGQIIPEAMPYVSKLHDSISVEHENNKFRKYINSNEVSSYDQEIKQYRLDHFTD
jgi:hypothetical protein